MVHVIDMGMPLPELLAQLRPGDVVTHCFHGNDGGLLDADERVWPEAFAARERGILFDVGHGVGSFTWRVARAALAQGFPPDTISSDIHAYNHAGPVHDLPRTLSKLLHLGMPLERGHRRRNCACRPHTSPTWRPRGSARSRPVLPATSACWSASAAGSRSWTASTASRTASPSTPSERLVARSVVRAGAVLACDEPT